MILSLDTPIVIVIAGAGIFSFSFSLLLFYYEVKKYRIIFTALILCGIFLISFGLDSADTHAKEAADAIRDADCDKLPETKHSYAMKLGDRHYKLLTDRLLECMEVKP